MALSFFYGLLLRGHRCYECCPIAVIVREIYRTSKHFFFHIMVKHCTCFRDLEKGGTTSMENLEHRHFESHKLSLIPVFDLMNEESLNCYNLKRPE